MDFAIGEELQNLGYGLAFFGELLVLIVLGKLAMGFLAGYDLDKELTENDNPAVAISFAGYVAGMLVALSGAFAGDGSSFVDDLIGVAIWGAFAIAALNLARVITDKLLLKGFGNVEELVRDRNIGVGVCEASGYLAGGLIIRASIAGEGAWWLGPVYLVIGLALLVIGGTLLRAVVFRKYKIAEEMEADNHAAGILYGLHLLAVGQILHAVLLDTSVEAVIAAGADAATVAKAFGIDLALMLVYTVIGLVAMTILNALTDRLMLPSNKLHDEIINDRNTGAALIAGSVSVFGAILIMVVF